KELESVGITAAQFTANRDKVLGILSDAFQEDVDKNPPIENKKAGQRTHILSAFSSKSEQLLAAAEQGNLEEARNLLAKKAYIDTENSKGLTPLILAVRERNFKLTELFLSYKADVNKVSKAVRNGTINPHRHGPLGWVRHGPLGFAVAQHDVAIIDLLLDHGALINRPRSGGEMTLLHDAVLHNNINIVNTLLDRGADRNAKPRPWVATPLEMAIEHGSYQIVETLVKHVYNVNQTSRGDAALDYAVRVGRFDIVLYLVQHGAHVNTDTLLTAFEHRSIQYLDYLLLYYKQAHGPKADLSNLVLAASKVGHDAALSLLLENGADINATLKEQKMHENGLVKGGQTLVWFTAAGGHYRSLNLLLTKGADIARRAYPKGCEEHDFKDCMFVGNVPDDCTAIQIAISHGHWDCARLLARYGGDPNASMHLVIRARGNGEERLQNLLEIGADPNAENIMSNTPLHVISPYVGMYAHRQTMARFLVTKGANVNYQNKRGATPLHFALEIFEKYGKRNLLVAEFIEFLLENGADPNIKDCKGRTPSYHSSYGPGQPYGSRIYKALVKAGAATDSQGNLLKQ
ncbi:MAG: hypothetical protein Q9174_006715, partial [Haloplaca sp. 1 TL-2023]